MTYTPETRYRKGRDGWQGETTVPLGFQIEDKPAQLRLSTYKNSSRGGLSTYATVQTRDGGFVTTRVFRDFHLCCRNLDTRVTEKSMTAEHEHWLTNLEQGYNLIGMALVHHTDLGDINVTGIPGE